MNCSSFKWIIVLVGFTFVLVSCSQSADDQRSGEITSTNSLPEVVQPSETDTPSGSSGLLPGTPGVVVPGAETPAGGNPASGTPGAANAQDSFGAVLATHLVEFPLAGPSGEAGILQGLLLDPQSGQIQYLAVETTGPQPKRDLLIPWGAFQVVTLPKKLENQATAPSIYLSEAAADLSNVPETDLDSLKDPKSLGPGWDADAHQYWAEKIPGVPVSGAQPESGAAPLFIAKTGRVGLDFNVQDTQGKEIGEAKDFILTSEGKVSFMLLSAGTLGDLSGNLVPVPWDKVQWSPDQQAFQLNISEQALKNAPRFDPNSVPPMASPGWNTEWLNYWQGAR